MANTCKPCKENIFKTISSNPDILELLELSGVGGDGKIIEVEGDNLEAASLFIDRVENDESKTFTLRYSPYTPLSIQSFTDNVGLQLKGSTLTTFQLDWTYNKAVESQSLDNGLTAPAVTQAESYSLTPTGLAITSNTTFTLTADDIDADGNSPKTSSISITFANYIYRTQIAIADRNNITTSTINQLDLTALTKTLQTNRSLTFGALSGSTEYEIILIPSSYGLTSGTQFKDTATNFTGGWGKLFDMNLTNSAGFEESYGVWASANKNLNGLTFQIT